jgi:hypothetical protein
MQVGDTVVIRTGINSTKRGTGTIAKISKTGKKVVVTLANGVNTDFYRDDRKDGLKDVYINNPGAGIFGHMLNDKFLLHEVRR